MLKSTHIRIAHMIAAKLKLPQQAASYLAGGSVAPDDWKDFPHHFGKEWKTRSYIVNARRHFVNGQHLQSLSALGVAFHYIQDKWVTVSSKDGMKHSDWERRIDSSTLIPLEQTANGMANLVQHSFSVFGISNLKQSNEYLSLANACMKYFKWTLDGFKDFDGQRIKSEVFALTDWRHPTLGTAFLDLNFSHLICLMVALAVYLPATCSAVQEQLEKTKKEFQIKLDDANKQYTSGIYELVKKKDTLRKGLVFARLKSLFYSLKIRAEKRNRNHALQEIRQEYISRVNEKAKPFAEWYRVTIPALEQLAPLPTYLD